jgi:hypothetical protein
LTGDKFFFAFLWLLLWGAFIFIFIFIVVKTQYETYLLNRFLSIYYSFVNYKHSILCQSSRTSSCMTEFLHPLNSNFLFLPPSRPWQPPFYFLLWWVDYFKFLTLVNHAVFVLLWLAYFIYAKEGLRFIHIVAYERISFFLWLNNIPL